MKQATSLCLQAGNALIQVFYGFLMVFYFFWNTFCLTWFGDYYFSGAGWFQTGFVLLSFFCYGRTCTAVFSSKTITESRLVYFLILFGLAIVSMLVQIVTSHNDSSFALPQIGMLAILGLKLLLHAKRCMETATQMPPVETPNKAD